MFYFTHITLLIVEILTVLLLIIILFSGLFSSWKGAPYVPMKRKLVKDLLNFGGLSADNIFYDLGSGNGQVVISAIHNFNVKKSIGYEISPWPFFVSKIKTKKYKNIELIKDDFFNADLSAANFIYLYLFPKLVDRLADKLDKELKTGTKVLCPSFAINIQKHPNFLLKKEAKIGNITAYLYEKI